MLPTFITEGSAKTKLEVNENEDVIICKITADGDCSHEMKRRLLLGRKVMTNPDSILKSYYFTILKRLLCQQRSV